MNINIVPWQVVSHLRGSPRAFGAACATPGNVSATSGKNPSGSPGIFVPDIFSVL